MRTSLADGCQLPWLWLYLGGGLLCHHLAIFLYRGDDLEHTEVFWFRDQLERFDHVAFIGRHSLTPDRGSALHVR